MLYDDLPSAQTAQSFLLHRIIGFLLYFIGYKTEFVSFRNNPKDLHPSCKTDLNLWDCLGRVKLVLQQNFIGLV